MPCNSVVLFHMWEGFSLLHTFVHPDFDSWATCSISAFYHFVQVQASCAQGILTGSLGPGTSFRPTSMTLRAPCRQVHLHPSSEDMPTLPSACSVSKVGFNNVPYMCTPYNTRIDDILFVYFYVLDEMVCF